MTQAAFFDLDKTVIAKAAMLAFGPRLRSEGLLSRWLVARALWGQIVFRYLGADESRMEKMRKAGLKVAAGWERDRIAELVASAITDVIDPIVYREALDLIEFHQLAGRRVYLVSASPEEIVRPLANYLGVQGAIASRARVDDSGRYTGEIEFFAAGANKVAAIEAEAELHQLDLDSSYAYSDSITDLPLLERVGHPTAVNPDKALLKVAVERDWEIQVFEHPEPLSDRRSLRPSTPAALGLVASVAGVGAALWWRSRRLLRKTPKGRWRSPLTR
jgi:HAD superfamily hydrolase (TIGR01490 family)